MQINLNKTIAMTISIKKMSYPYEIDGNVIKNVDEYKNPGLTFPCDLNWNVYIESLTQQP